MIERELTPGDNTGRGFVVEAGDLSQEQVNGIADQLPDGVFDALNGQNLSEHSVGTRYQSKSGYESFKGSDAQDTIDVGNQIGTGLVPPSTEFPTPSGLVHTNVEGTNGQAYRANGRNAVTNEALAKGITQVISTTIHERGHQGPYGDTPREERRLRSRVNGIMEGVGANPNSYSRGCPSQGGC